MLFAYPWDGVCPAVTDQLSRANRFPIKITSVKKRKKKKQGQQSKVTAVSFASLARIC